MITLIQLHNLSLLLNEKAQPIVAEYKRLKEMHEAEMTKLAAPLNSYIEAYLLQELRDNHGNPVFRNNILQKGNKQYVVTDRGLRQYSESSLLYGEATISMLKLNTKLAAVGAPIEVSANRLNQYTIKPSSHATV